VHQRRWQIRKIERNCLKQLSAGLSLPFPIARTLMNRGVFTPQEAAQYFDPGLSFLQTLRELPHLSSAVTLLDQVVRRGGRILVFGDYDADGLTACALLTKFLRTFHSQVEPVIPNRFRDGYGLSAHVAHSLVERNPALVITVDCGIKDHSGVSFLKRKGIRVIVTDHHLPETGKIPEADVIVCTCDHISSKVCIPLSGVGVALALAQAYAEYRGLPMQPVEEYLGLACVGTVGDMVPLLGENRVIVKYGLKKLNYDPGPALGAMIEAAGLRGRNLGSEEVGFILAPRLNAAGRVDDPSVALDLLLCEDYALALEKAQQLNSLNEKRRREGERVLRDVSALSSNSVFLEDEFVVLSGSGWSIGVLGIVASRMSELLYRPVMVLGENGSVVVGSSRSIPGFHLANALNEASGFLLQFGGHKMAAGLKLKKENVDPLRLFLNERFGDDISSLRQVRGLVVDAQVDLSDINCHLLQWLDRMKPFGEQNQNPLFAALNVTLVKSWTWGKRNQHLKILSRQKKDFQEAIIFSGSEKASEITSSSLVDLAFEVYRDGYNNYPCLNVRDWRIKK